MVQRNLEKALLKELLESIVFDNKNLTVKDSYTPSTDVFPYAYIMSDSSETQLASIKEFDIYRYYNIIIAFRYDPTQNAPIYPEVDMENMEQLVFDKILRNPEQDIYQRLELVSIQYPNDNGFVVRTVDDQIFLTVRIKITNIELYGYNESGYPTI